jgi:hypothetical protein
MRKTEFIRAALHPSTTKTPPATPPPPGAPITPEQVAAAEAYLAAKRDHDAAQDLVFDTAAAVDPEGAARGDEIATPSTRQKKPYSPPSWDAPRPTRLRSAMNHARRTG